MQDSDGTLLVKEFYDLKRKVYSSQVCQDTGSFPWTECLAEYNCAPVNDLAGDCYSKLEAIGNLRKFHHDTGRIQLMLRALLTDRGLLFPQTRERYDSGVTCSMKWSMNRKSLVRTVTRLRVDENKSGLERLLSYTKDISESLYGDTSAPISLEKSQAGIKMLFEGREDSLSSFQLLQGDGNDAGYCKGELGKLSSTAPQEERESIMRAWLDNVSFQFGTGSPIRAYNFFKQTAGPAGSEQVFTTTELFEFLANVLPRCLQENGRFEEAKKPTDYRPVLAANQKAALQKQIEDFKREDLSVWRTALPALKEYLHPDLEHYRHLSSVRAEFDKVRTEHSLKDFFNSFILNGDYLTKLESAFSQYLKQMEPGVLSKRKAKRDDDPVSGLPGFFAGYWTKEAGKPFFLDQPMVMFQIFRSPVYRYLYQREDRSWSIRRIVNDACVRYPLPITAQSLQADTALYHAIVDFCDESCRALQVDFDRKPWDALWLCVCQSVQCLQFRMEDLFSVQYQFRRMMKFGKSGFPVLDRWFEQAVSGQQAPAYISLWRGLVNKLCRSSREQDSEFSNAVSAYRKYFTSPVTDEEHVWQCLSGLCGKIAWSHVKAAPSEGAYKIAAGEIGVSISTSARNGPYATAKSHNMVRTIKGRKFKVTSIRAVELFQMEWPLLQCVCDQARRELMESVYLYLSKA